MTTVNHYYIQVVTPQDECAKHGRDWMFKRKNPPSTPTTIQVSEYTYICLACIFEHRDNPEATCTWTRPKDMQDFFYFDTECKKDFGIDWADPDRDLMFTYCPYCGKRIKEV